MPAKDIERIHKLNGSFPDNIKTVDEWNQFVDLHLGLNDDSTNEGRLIKLLLQDAGATII